MNVHSLLFWFCMMDLITDSSEYRGEIEDATRYLFNQNNTVLYTYRKFHNQKIDKYTKSKLGSQ